MVMWFDNTLTEIKGNLQMTTTYFSNDKTVQYTVSTYKAGKIQESKGMTDGYEFMIQAMLPYVDDNTKFVSIPCKTMQQAKIVISRHLNGNYWTSSWTFNK